MQLVLKDLRFSYGRQEILTGVSASSPLTGLVGVLGANGAGKSTLLKCIGGLLASTGRAEILHDDGSAASRAERSSLLGYVPQDQPGDVALTVLEAVLVGLRRRGGLRTSREDIVTAAECLEELGISHLGDRYLGELSGGQRQLASLAQMTVRRPRVMLLDEPTSALDLRHQVSVLEYVSQRTRAGRGVTLIALHDLNLAARFCDRLLVLRDGVCAADGAPADVLTCDTLRRTYGVCARVLDDGGVPVVTATSALAEEAGGQDPRGGE